MSRSARGAPRSLPEAGSELVTPAWLTALALLLLNDHVGKGHRLAPGWLTGKLSDVAGLFLFPVLLVALARGVRPVGTARAVWLAGVAAVMTAVAFAVVKLSPDLTAWLALHGWLIRPDASDLVTLPAVALAHWWYRRWCARPRPAGRSVRAAAVTAGLLASAASSPPPIVIRPLPAWTRVAPGETAVGCATADVWVAKSGKTGLGLGLALGADVRCPVTLTHARLRIGGAEVTSAAPLPQAFELAPNRRTHVYLPFVFDNDRAWRAGDRAGEVALDFRADGRSVHWKTPLVQRFSPEALAKTAELQRREYGERPDTASAEPSPDAGRERP